jgi:hypothetical protein
MAWPVPGKTSQRRQDVVLQNTQVKHRAAIALRMDANSLCRAKGYFGEFFRRMRAKLGTAQAITATAHKIARFLYHVLLTRRQAEDGAYL